MDTELPAGVTAPRAPIASGLKVIIGYKFAKAALELLAGATGFIMGSVGLAATLSTVAREIRHHVTEAWSIALAERLLDASTAHHVFVVAMAISADGIVTLVEAWALQRGYAWAGWLVLLTTASLLPFEVIALLRHPNAGHTLLLIANALIVVYLVRHELQLHGRKVAPGDIR